MPQGGEGGGGGGSGPPGLQATWTARGQSAQFRIVVLCCHHTRRPVCCQPCFRPSSCSRCQGVWELHLGQIHYRTLLTSDRSPPTSGGGDSSAARPTRVGTNTTAATARTTTTATVPALPLPAASRAQAGSRGASVPTSSLPPQDSQRQGPGDRAAPALPSARPGRASRASASEVIDLTQEDEGQALGRPQVLGGATSMWTCLICTLENGPAAWKCAACDHARAR